MPEGHNKKNPALLRNDLHRKNDNYPQHIYYLRVLWALLKPFFRYSPRCLYTWRNGLLKLLGAKIAKQVRIYPSVEIFYPWNLTIEEHTTIGDRVKIYNLGRVSIGKHVLISQYAHLCAGGHDYRYENYPLLKEPVVVEDHCWIGADAFVGQGVSIKRGSVVGARSVVVKDVLPGRIVAGNPHSSIK